MQRPLSQHLIIHIFSLILFIFSLAVIPAIAADKPDDADEEYNFTPIADIVDIVEQSGRYDYHDTFFDRTKELEKHKERLKYADVDQVLIDVAGVKKVDVYRPSKIVAEYIKQAAELRSTMRPDQALEILKMALAEDSNYSSLHVLIGQIYLDQHRYSDALLEFNRALQVNPINFTAYKMKAATYLSQGDLARCRESLVNALILNRNDEETWNMLKKLGEKMGFIVYDYPFLPLYSFQKMDNGKVRIYMDTDDVIRWMPYSFCKAMWRYEPGYFEKKTGEKEYRPTVFEEMEAINCMLWSYNAFKMRGRIDHDRLLDRMELIKSRFFIKEFVYFEVVSPTRPDVLATLDEKHMEDMQDYVNEFILVKDPRQMKKLKPIKDKQSYPVQ